MDNDIIKAFILSVILGTISFIIGWRLGLKLYN